MFVCAWAYKGVCEFRWRGRYVGVLACGCAQGEVCTHVSVPTCVHMGAHICAYMHLGGPCAWLCKGTHATYVPREVQAVRGNMEPVPRASPTQR